MSIFRKKRKREQKREKQTSIVFMISLFYLKAQKGGGGGGGLMLNAKGSSLKRMKGPLCERTPQDGNTWRKNHCEKKVLSLLDLMC